MRFLFSIGLSVALIAGVADVSSAELNSLPAINAYIKKNADLKMPDGYQLPLGICDEANAVCRHNSAITLQDLKAAYKKNYDAQRNVAFCLTTGCDGGVQINETLGCAWRIVILASGNPSTDDGDRSNLKSCLNKMDGTKLATTKAQAASLFGTIYKREISPDWQ